MHTHRPLRLSGSDDTSGVYLVTVCARERACLFGEVVCDRMVHGGLGVIADAAWRRIGLHHEGIDLDALVVMPNHVHAILILDRSAPGRPPPLPAVVGMAKARASRRAGFPIWQRGFHDRVIRNERELEAARAYVDTNPSRWALDRENPQRLPGRRAA